MFPICWFICLFCRTVCPHILNQLSNPKFTAKHEPKGSTSNPAKKPNKSPFFNPLCLFCPFYLPRNGIKPPGGNFLSWIMNINAITFSSVLICLLSAVCWLKISSCAPSVWTCSQIQSPHLVDTTSVKPVSLNTGTLMSCVDVPTVKRFLTTDLTWRSTRSSQR